MKIISDPARLEQFLDEYQIRAFFETEGLSFSLRSYDRGELIVRPQEENPYILFVVEGSVSIYAIFQDGRQYTVAECAGFSILGDLEFAGQKSLPLFAEASEPVLSVALSRSEYQEALCRDNRFLQVLLRSISEKMIQSFQGETDAVSLEERLVRHIRCTCPNQTLTQVEKTANRLHCSRRQLQRVLKKLLDDEILHKQGKGTYRLAPGAAISSE